MRLSLTFSQISPMPSSAIQATNRSNLFHNVAAILPEHPAFNFL